MKLAYTITYVPDVAASLTFFEQAFDLKRKFLHESGTYGECDECGCDIPFARLQIEPQTQHCVTCKSRWERETAAVPTARM